MGAVGDRGAVSPYCGDVIWVPYGDLHSLENDGEEDCIVLESFEFSKI